MRNDNSTSLQLNRKRASFTLEKFKVLYQQKQHLLLLIQEGVENNIISFDEARKKKNHEKGFRRIRAKNTYLKNIPRTKERQEVVYAREKKERKGMIL